MEIRPLKLKRKRSGDKKLELPLRNKKEIVGVFDGLNVVVHDLPSMNYLYKEGCFGKGSFSKREPNYHTKKDDIPKIVFEQQMKNQSGWNHGFKYVCSQKQFGSRNDGYELSAKSVQNFLESSLDSSDENCQKSQLQMSRNERDLKRELSCLVFHSAGKLDEKFKGLVDEILQSRQSKKPVTSSFKSKNEVIILNAESNKSFLAVDAIDARLESDVFLPEENLNLNWEESLYLKSVLGCLKIIDSEERNLTSNELWEKFNRADKNFLKRYVTYHFFRSKGWIVRSGLKFGGDYLLYKIGPAHYHSNYLVKVLNEKKMSWRELIVNNRLAETFNKEVIFVKVSPCEEACENVPFPELLENYMVEATLVTRWFPSKERNSKNRENLF